jgi:prepilin-type processing-associated H-X9-DG protein
VATLVVKSPGHGGFTVVEMIAVICVMAFLAVILIPTAQWLRREGMAAKSTGNLRQLATANLAYAADHDGAYCPAQEPRNRGRWHGGRVSTKDKFEPAEGFLAPYLGLSRQIGLCPLMAALRKSGQTFEEGTGGYGYNAAYIGGTPANPYKPTNVMFVPRPSRTIMFATTALARGEGVQEYPYVEPFQWVNPNGKLSGPLQPSLHFRANGYALVAWCDGHVSKEKPGQLGGGDYYGGDSKKQQIGWFGPKKDNGYWNPNFEP